MVMESLSKPDLRQHRRLRQVRNASLIAGLMLLSGGVGWWLSHADQGVTLFSTEASTTAETPVAVPVKTEVVRSQDVTARRTLTGTVEPAEKVTLTSRIVGQIQQLRVDEGDRVPAGAVIAVIDVNDIQAQRGQAQAGVNMAQSNYQQAQGRLQETRAQLLEAQADLADAQLEQQRMSRLRSEGAISQQVLDKANTRVKVNQARMQQLRAGITQSQATMNQAQAQVRQAQAQVEQVGANLQYGTVTAPFNGVVTRKHTEVGAMAGPGQHLVTLESSDRLRFTTQVPESLITQIKPGQSVTVRLDALKRNVAAQVSQIIPSGNPTTRNFTVKATLVPSPDLLPGMFGRLQLAGQTPAALGSSRSTLFIPQAALVKQFGITGVYKVANGQAVFQPVTTGKAYGADIEVFSGITAGDRVVINPPSEVKEGTTLQVI